MRVFLAAALAGSFAALSSNPTKVEAAADEAVAYQNNPSHSGLQSGDALRPLLTRKWSVDLNAGRLTYPVVGRGMIYVTAGTQLMALDQADGRIVWSASLGGHNYASAPALDNGNLFAINDQGSLQAFNASNGARTWTVTLGDGNINSFDASPTAANGRVYVSGNNTLYAVDETSGTTRWARAVLYGHSSSPVVATSGVYVSYPGEVYDFEPGTGTLLWNISHGGGGGGLTPVLHGNRLYVRDFILGNVILDATTGSQLGTFVSDTVPAFDGSIGFFTTHDTEYGDTLEARNLADDTVRWSFAGDGGITAPPVIANGFLYVGSLHGRVWALEESTGRVVWSDNAGGGIRPPLEGTSTFALSGMAIGNGLLIIPASTSIVVYTSSGVAPPPPPAPTPLVVPAGPNDVAFQVDNGHSGAQPSETIAPPLPQRWSVDLGGTVSYPLVAQGMAFVTTSIPSADIGGAKLWALNLQDGKSVWGPVDLYGGLNYNRAGITYDGGTVFALNFFGMLQAFDAGTGVLKWSRKMPGQYYAASPPTAYNGVVYVTAEENGSTVYGVDESNGNVLWAQHQGLGGSFQSSPAVSGTGFYVSYICAQIYDYAPSDGHLLWHYGTNCTGGGGTTPVLFGNRIYVKPPTAGLVLDAASGSVLGTFSSTTIPAFDGTRGFFLDNGTLEAHDLATNAVLWSFSGDGHLDSAPLVVKGTVYIGSSTGAIYGVAESNGSQVWSDNTGAPILAPDESTGAIPITGLGEGEGTLLVPASTKLAAYGAWTPGPSPPPPGPSPSAYAFANSTQQYVLQGSDGATFTTMDASKLEVTVTPPADGTAVVTGNADMWTDTAGYNQDLGIAVSIDGGAYTVLSWKESGGFNGTYSPNAAAVQLVAAVTSGQRLSFRLVWKSNKPQALGVHVYAGAGPIDGAFSATSLSVRILPRTSVVSRAATDRQYGLAFSDGSHWLPLDNRLAITLNPAAGSVIKLMGNADLWTERAGVNQDLAILLSIDGGAVQTLTWKESGGFGGTYSPNAALAQALYTVPSGAHSYQFSLAWKTNLPYDGFLFQKVHAGAGPLNGAFSPTGFTAQVLPATSGAQSVGQYTLEGSDGATWAAIDPSRLTLTIPAGATPRTMVLGANADLWTDTAGFNQDLAIFVSAGGGADQLVAWKESGGFNGTYSPNAAFVQAAYRLQPGGTYVFTLRWKSNKAMPSNAGIYAGAGPLGSDFSPTSLIAEIVS